MLEMSNHSRWSSQEGKAIRVPVGGAALDNAKALGISRELGSIEVGKRADLLLLKDSPLISIAAYDSIETIVLNGEPIARESLRAD